MGQGIAEALQYPEEIEEIVRYVQAQCPSCQPRVFDYARDPSRRGQKTTATGKVLFQYDLVQAWATDPDDDAC